MSSHCCFLHDGTGQERKEIPFAQHTACTIEMTNLQRRVDVAVVDEIQVAIHIVLGCHNLCPTVLCCMVCATALTDVLDSVVRSVDSWMSSFSNHGAANWGRFARLGMDAGAARPGSERDPHVRRWLRAASSQNARAADGRGAGGVYFPYVQSPGERSHTICLQSYVYMHAM